MSSEVTSGYICVLVAILCFGSNWVPVKKINIGDGVFFQFIMCCAIFATSLPVIIAMNFPEIHGLALFGGFLWCTGNMLCPLSIRCIGLGLGLLVWGSVSMLMGWASGTFGLFGLKKSVISESSYNYAGVALAMVGLIIYLQVQTKGDAVKKIEKEYDDTENIIIHPINLPNDPLIPSVKLDGVTFSIDSKRNINTEMKEDFIDQLSPTNKRIAGLIMAVIAGVFFGCAFDPAQYVNDTEYDGNDNSLNYVFTHFCGIFLTSWLYTVIYCAQKAWYGEVPYINYDCILPATISGILWGIANICWFVANGSLGLAIAFPIITSGPGFIGALWGIFVFDEISGTKNIMVLVAAATVTMCGLVLVALSR